MKIEKSHPAFAELRAGARGLMQKISALQFLAFLLEAMHYRHHAVLYSSRRVDPHEDQFYTINVIMDHMILPWLAGGSDVAEELAMGFSEVLIYCSAEGIRQLNNEIFASFGFYSDGVDWTSETQHRFLEGMAIMLILLQHAEAAELAMKETSLAVA